ncbi:8042_t:CDS:2 [Ambispora leptoticha]|uniref:8042_t:CDS:1 n=1 Tax=Ambispora leptoticha TaxID=144679 RepID=A0A9N8VBT5_9GLOM|nr:8042_t:CDS:2 [Ambispora leptoticha]
MTLIGTLHLTTHQLIFRHPQEEMWILYPTIHTVERRPLASNGLWPLLIKCRDFVFVTISVPSEREAIDVFESIQKLTCIKGSIEQLYAFFYKPPSLTANDGWHIYDPLVEFDRMGVGSKTRAWRISYKNKSYELCPTYPRILVVPDKILDSVLTHACKFRSKCRIPTLSYLHWSNMASITRSSQPMVGLKQNRSLQDEKIIEAIFQSTALPPTPSGQPVYGSTATNLIIDARPTANAMANVAMGAGTENMDNYKNCSKQYMGIDNIHVMRESLGKLVEVIQNADVQGLPIKKHHLDKSNWLKHISSLLESSLVIIKNIHVNSSHVLIHCSDGWDRTAQLTSISELCLDPYYRTLRGFEVLIEKDWLSFGHKFSDRSGHLSNERYFITSSTNAANNAFNSMQNKLKQSHVREISPVFHQFLDCVFQILAQYPERFEFNEHFLVTLHFHLYSCQYGTFLFNSEKERNDYKVMTSTYSVWDYINSNKEQFLNPSYDYGARDREEMGDKGVLFPESDWKKLKYWASLFDKRDEELNGEEMVEEASPIMARSLWGSDSPVQRSSSPIGISNGIPWNDEQSQTITSRISKNLNLDIEDPWRDNNTHENDELIYDEPVKSLHHKESSNELNAMVQNFARITLNLGVQAVSNVANILDAASGNLNNNTNDNSNDFDPQSSLENHESRSGLREMVSFSNKTNSITNSPPSKSNPFSSLKSWNTLSASIGFPTTSLKSRENKRNTFPTSEIADSATTTPPISPRTEPHPLFLYDS